MRNRLNVAAILALSLLAGGCSWFSWLPWVDSKPKPDEPADLTSYKAQVTISQRWSASIGSGLGKKYVRLTPYVVADRVVAADAYGNVEAHDRFKGKRLWKTRVGRPHSSTFGSGKKDTFLAGGVGGGEGLVLVGTTRAEVIALGVADGKEKWRTQVSSEVLSAPTAGQSLAYAATSDGRLVALDAGTGEQKWTYDTQVPPLSLRGTSAPVFDHGVVVTGFANGKVGAFRAASGEPLWDQRIMLPQGRSELERIVDVDGTPIFRPTAIFAASFQGRVKALRPSDGSVIWEHETSTSVDLAESFGHVYVVNQDDDVLAFDERNGDVAWEQRGLFRRKLSPPVAFDNYVVVADSDGYVHVLAASDGRFLGRKKVDGSGIRSPMIEADGLVYLLGNSGKLAALSIAPKK